MASEPTLSPTASLTDEPTSFLDTSIVKKSRRQTAFYPNVNSTNKPLKPFSRSAAKRESVMALGSIEHLQHYFTKTGIAAKKNPLKPASGTVPAIGGPVHLRNAPSIGNIDEFDLPPSPAVPSVARPPYPIIEKTYETDPENLKPGVIQDLSAVSQAWGLSSGHGSSDPELLGLEKGKGKGADDFDVLATLKSTTRAIRSVRNYLVSLPDETAAPQTEKLQFRPRTFSPTAPKRLVSNPNAVSEPLTLIRRSALEVLTVLRALEESSRLPLSDDAYDAQSEQGSYQGAGSNSRGASPNHVDDDPDTSFAFPVMSVPGRPDTVPVWPDDDDDDGGFDDENTEKGEAWDRRLVLGGGWLYKQDILLADVAKERDAVAKYLDSVDDVLFGGPIGQQRGWERVTAERQKLEREGRGKGRRVSAGGSEGRGSPALGNRSQRIVSAGVVDTMRDMVLSEEPDEESGTFTDEEAVDDDHLPGWARRTAFTDNPLARLYSLLSDLLPANMLLLLPTTPDRAALLESLSSGQLLCLSYNVAVRRSKKPWGYINKDAIHDIVTLEAKIEPTDTGEAAEKRIKGWTFRRIDNLRLWAAALKLRYLLPIVGLSHPHDAVVNTPTASPSPAVNFTPSNTSILFDAKTIARKEEGWDGMLEAAVLRWCTVILEEKRGER